MNRVLVVSGHTDLNDSVANKTILEELAKDLPDAEFDYLDREYPDYKIDVEAEQKKLAAADVIVLQFPLFWYSMPSILERWMEETFVHGFSHGSTGDKLHGKKLILSVTIGAPEEMYTKEGHNVHSLDEYLVKVPQIARFTGMDLAGEVATYGVSYMMRTTPEGLASIKEKAKAHADKVAKIIASL